MAEIKEETMAFKPILLLTAAAFISFSAANVVHAASGQYASVSQVRCTQILKEYYWRPEVKLYYYWDQSQLDLSSAEENIVAKVGDVNPVSAHDAIVCECKLQPTQTIGSAVQRVISEGKKGRWYVNPLGGTQSPRDATFREKVEKWFAGEGPRPSIDRGKACELK